MHTLLFKIKDYILFVYMLCAMYIVITDIAIPSAFWLWTLVIAPVQAYATYVSYRNLRLHNKQ